MQPQSVDNMMTVGGPTTRHQPRRRASCKQPVCQATRGSWQHLRLAAQSRVFAWVLVCKEQKAQQAKLKHQALVPQSIDKHTASALKMINSRWE